MPPGDKPPTARGSAFGFRELAFVHFEEGAIEHPGVKHREQAHAQIFQLPFADHAAPSGEGIDHGSIATARRGYPAELNTMRYRHLSAEQRETAVKNRVHDYRKTKQYWLVDIKQRRQQANFATLFSCRERLRIAISTSGKVEPIPPISR